MTTLHLGVIDIPYDDPTPRPKKAARTRRGRANRPRRTKKTPKHMTTGDVAELLEARYDVMSHFFDEDGQRIADAMAEALVGSFETVAMGGPAPADPLAVVADPIKELFHEFIDSEAMAGLEDGVPTAAALKGVSHRFKHPYARGHPRRPSFVDTGQYRESFVASVTED